MADPNNADTFAPLARAAPSRTSSPSPPLAVAHKSSKLLIGLACPVAALTNDQCPQRYSRCSSNSGENIGQYRMGTDHPSSVATTGKKTLLAASRAQPSNSVTPPYRLARSAVATIPGSATLATERVTAAITKGCLFLLTDFRVLGYVSCRRSSVECSYLSPPTFSRRFAAVVRVYGNTDSCHPSLRYESDCMPRWAKVIEIRAYHLILRRCSEPAPAKGAITIQLNKRFPKKISQLSQIYPRFFLYAVAHRRQIASFPLR